MLKILRGACNDGFSELRLRTVLNLKTVTATTSSHSQPKAKTCSQPENQKIKMVAPPGGSMAGKIYISDDFDDPLTLDEICG